MEIEEKVGKLKYALRMHTKVCWDETTKHFRFAWGKCVSPTFQTQTNK